MKKGKIAISLVILLIAGFGLGFAGFYVVDYIKEANTEIPEQNYVYPQAERDQGISVEYTAEVLKKKAAGETLTAEEKDLIHYCSVQNDGFGIAVTRFYEGDGGMGKASRRFWETADGGKTWNVLQQGMYSIGYIDFAYIDNVFVESAFSTTALKGYFNISRDRGHTFESIPYEEVFAYEGMAYAVKLDESAERKTVTYQWFDFETQEAISIIEYDLDLNVIKEIEG